MLSPFASVRVAVRVQIRWHLLVGGLVSPPHLTASTGRQIDGQRLFCGQTGCLLVHHHGLCLDEKTYCDLHSPWREFVSASKVLQVSAMELRLSVMKVRPMLA